jgi:hypothetical protein
MNNINEIVSVVNDLVGLVYDLYPDDEYVELYGVNEKIARAQALINKLGDDND